MPPAFYPGQAIPVLLTFCLDRYSSLPHRLNPSLTISLIGTLHLPNGAPRTIICVSVSLAEGLQLWARDARHAYAARLTRDHSLDPATCLPGGTYSLPLTVQVPSSPRLPPSFAVPGAKFAVTYTLAASLDCDDPLRTGRRINLAEANGPFEMMPETLPMRTPRYNETSFSVRTLVPQRRSTAPRWTIEPSLPTTTYSPSSRIPITLRLTPPQGSVESYQVLLRIALVRREYSSLSDSPVRDPTGQAGLVSEVDVVSTMAWFEINRLGVNIHTSLPIMTSESWPHGFSTMLNVTPAEADPETGPIIVSSTFHLASTFAFLACGEGQPALTDLISEGLPPQGVFTPPTAGSTLDMISLKRHFPGTVRTLPLPVVIGSVSEPHSAMQIHRWSDVHFDSSSGQEVGRVITGEGVSCEDGWIQAPPSYCEALDTAPYEF